MTGLEALKELKHWKETNNENGVVWIPLFAVEDIEQSLIKAEKEHKALEIIKEKKINVGTFIHLTKVLKKDYEQCKALNNTFGANICDTEKDFLTQEEFNLLKEVLE